MGKTYVYEEFCAVDNEGNAIAAGEEPADEYCRPFVFFGWRFHPSDLFNRQDLKRARVRVTYEILDVETDEREGQ